jgi:Ras family protein T1
VTLAYLAYLGYTHASSSSTILPTTSALSITRPRKLDRKKGSMSRSVFLAYVVGATGSGKTELLRNFIGRRFQGVYESTGKVKTVVNAVEIGGEEKYLVVSLSIPSPKDSDIPSRSDREELGWIESKMKKNNPFFLGVLYIVTRIWTESSCKNVGISIEETRCPRLGI